VNATGKQKKLWRKTTALLLMTPVASGFGKTNLLELISLLLPSIIGQLRQSPEAMQLEQRFPGHRHAPSGDQAESRSLVRFGYSTPKAQLW